MNVPLLWNLVFNADMNDEIYLEHVHEERVKIHMYYENVVMAYSPDDFQMHFRVTRATFERLLQIFGPLFHNENIQLRISVEKKIAIALWYFGNQEVFRSVADRFGVSKDTAWRSVFQFAEILARNAQTYIKWPTFNQMAQIEEEFYAVTGFPGVIGAIDGCHIQISAPTQNANSYVNRKGYHSILLQGICNSRLQFIDVFIGLCGSIHDARVWELSEIKTLIEAHNYRYFNSFYHLLADSAYPLSNRMLTPYRDNGHLNQIQINYNQKHASTRVIIERTFGILTGRFRKLKYIYMYATELIPLVVLACCILHNICIDFEDNPIEIDGIEDLEEINNEADNVDLDGRVKRDIIAHLLL